MLLTAFLMVKRLKLLKLFICSQIFTLGGCMAEEERVKETRGVAPSLVNMTSIKAAVFQRIPRKFHASLTFAKIQISSEMDNKNCVLRISKFEFKCSYILSIMKRTKNVLSSTLSQGMAQAQPVTSFAVICIILGMFVFGATMGIVIFLFIKKRGRGRVLVRSGDIVQLTSCQSSTSTV